jgi:Rrf2 family protein
MLLAHLAPKELNAIEAVVLVAIQPGGKALNSRDLCELLRCPERFLEPMLQKLVRAGILASQRGPGGGYVLGRERRRISLWDMLVALQPDKNPPSFASQNGKDVLSPVFAAAEASMRDELAQQTLDRMVKAHLLKAPQSMYNI